jgi:hypothetical protein
MGTKTKKPKTLQQRLKKVGGVGKHGACVNCLQGTDTVLAFQGEPEWCVAGMVHLGLPIQEAIATFHAGSDDGGVKEEPNGQVTVFVQVCSKCAGKVGMKVAIPMGDNPTAPVYRPQVRR